MRRGFVSIDFTKRNPECTIGVIEPRPWQFLLERSDLLSERQILEDEIATG